MNNDDSTKKGPDDSGPFVMSNLVEWICWQANVEILLIFA